jgi:hypothetical protein
MKSNYNTEKKNLSLLLGIIAISVLLFSAMIVSANQETNKEQENAFVSFFKNIGKTMTGWVSQGTVRVMVGDVTNPVVNLVSPSNETITGTSSNTFTCNITDDYEMSNITFYVWNSTDSIVNQTTVSLSGVSNDTSLDITLPSENEFKWNCLGYDDAGNNAWSEQGNYTLTYTIPSIHLERLYPTTNINVTQNEFFNITVNVTCLGSDCGDINVSFDPECSSDASVGDECGGGKVAYNNGSYVLISETSDQSTGKVWSEETPGEWVEIGTGTAIGTGSNNADAIVAEFGAGNYAAKVCDDYDDGTYDDWFLPSKDELDELYDNKDTIGGFASDVYWSSSEMNGITFYAWSQNFNDGEQNGEEVKSEGKYVRCVREESS